MGTVTDSLRLQVLDGFSVGRSYCLVAESDPDHTLFYGVRIARDEPLDDFAKQVS